MLLWQKTFLGRAKPRFRRLAARRKRRLLFEVFEDRSLLATWVNSGTAADAIYTLPTVSASDQIFLEDDGTVGNGTLQFRIHNGVFNSDDKTSIPSPSGSLTILAGTSPTSAITINALPDFTAAMTIGSAAGPLSTVALAGAVNLGANKNFAVYASGRISGSTGKIATSGSGAITLTTATDIQLTGLSSLTTVDGALTLSANQQTSPTSGDFTGVLISGVVKATGTGAVSVSGKSGDNSSQVQYGVDISHGTVTGGSGGLQIIGVGGAADVPGVVVENNSLVTALGIGPVTIQGTGGSAIAGNDGVSFRAGTITSGGGDVQIIGQGGAGTGIGVDIQGSLSAGGNGSVTVTGTGSSGTGSVNGGVHVSGSISSGGGNVTITGHGGGSGTSNNCYGVSIGGQVTAGNTGKVTVAGTGGPGSGSGNVGVLVQGSNAATTSSGGDVQVTGVGGGTGTSSGNYGIQIGNSGQISAGGAGAVIVQGTGGPGTLGANSGVLVQGTNATITSGGGNVQVTGIEGGGTSTKGLDVFTGSITTATNGGSITLVANSINVSSTTTISAKLTSSVTIKPFTTGVAVNLGTSTDPIGGPLNLTDPELDRITAGTINIGDANSGAITITADITRAASTAMNLTSGGAINFTGGQINTAGGNLSLSPGSAASVGVTKSATDVSMSSSGTLSFASGSDLAIAINGTTVDTQYNQLNVVGSVDLTGVDLALSGSSYTPQLGDSFVLVNNDGADAITGTFNGLPEGRILTIASGPLAGPYQITYQGGDGNDVVLTSLNSDAVLQGTSGDDVWLVARNGNNVDVTLNGAAFLSRSYTSLTTLTVNGLAGNDTLSVDLSGGNAIPSGGLFFNGGDPTIGPGDKLNILGGGQGTVTYNYTSGHDGSISMSNFGTVNYTGLEPISNTGAATSVVFNLPATASTAVLEDDGTSGNGISQLRSTSGTFETTAFASPTGTVTINRGNPADALTVNSLPDLTTSLAFGSKVFPLALLGLNGTVGLAPGKSLTAYAVAQSVTATGSVTTGGGGGIQLTADTLDIDAAATLNAGTGIVTLAPETTNKAVTLGAKVAGTLSLTDAELDRVVAGTLRLGDSTFGGPITIAAPINVANNATPIPTLHLLSGGAVINNSATSPAVTATNLAVEGFGGNGSSTTLTTQASNLAASYVGSYDLRISNSGDLTIADVDNLTGPSGSTGGATSLTTSGSMTVNSGVLTNPGPTLLTLTGPDALLTVNGFVNGAGDAILTADKMAITTFVSFPNDKVTLKPATAGAAINLGSTTDAAAGTLELSNAEIGWVRGKTMQIGDASSGAITVGAAITPSAGMNLNLTSGAAINFTAGMLSSGGGAIALAADSVEIGATSALNAGSGAVAISPLSSNVPISLGVETAGQLSLTDAELDRVTAETVNVGNATSGSITIAADITRAAATAMNLASGASINFTTGTINTNGGNLVLAPGGGGSVGVANVNTDVTVGAGTLSLGGNHNLLIPIYGTTEGQPGGFDVLNLSGNVNLAGANLVLSLTDSFTPAAGTTFQILNNLIAGNTTTGTFTGFAEGRVISATIGGTTVNFQITYQGGDGNDVVLTTLDTANPSLSGTTGNDTWLVKRNGTNVDVTLNGTVIWSPPFSSLSSLTINGLDGADVLTVDSSAGDPFPSGGITFHGGGQAGDKLITTGVPGGGSYTSITNNYTSTAPGHSGNIVLMGSQTDTLTYDGLAPIDISGSTATNLVFNLPAIPASLNNAFLEDEGTTGNGKAQLRSGNGAFETTVFANPSGTVTINPGNLSDTLTVNSLLSADFNAGLTVGSAANAFRDITFSGGLTLGGGKSLSTFSSTLTAASAAAIAVSGSGGISLATDFIDIGPSATLTAAGNVIVVPLTAGTPIDVGTASGGLSLTDADLDRITAGTINIGDANTGSITISAAIDRAAGSTTAINLATGTNNDIAFTGSGSLDAKNGNVTLLTNSSGIGAITGGTAAVDLSGANVSLTAGSGGIGSSGNPLVVSATNLNATTGGNGNQFLSTGGVTTIDATGLSAGTGTIELDGGTFTLGGSQRINDATKLNVNGATFAIGANNETIGGLTLTGGSVAGTTGVLTSTTTYQTQSGSISAILAGTNGLTQSSNGTTMLSGANLYTGATAVNGGHLVVTGRIGSSVSVVSGAALNGTGTTGAVSVADGGNLSPGLCCPLAPPPSPGILKSGNLMLSSGSQFNVELGGPFVGTTFDQQNVAGTVSLGGATLNLGLFFTPGVGDVFTIINNDGADAVSGTFSGLPEGAVFTQTNGSFTGIFQLTYQGGDGNDVVLTTISATEPVLPGTSGDDNWLVKRSGANLDVTLNGNVIWSPLFSTLNSLAINGLDGNDTLTVDLSAGDAVPPAGFYFNGSLPGNGIGDKLTITGGNQGDVTYNYASVMDGSVVMSNFGTLSYTGLESVITNTGTQANITFNLPATANTVFLEDEGTTGNGVAQLQSSFGTFETTAFANPTGSVTINRGTASDSLFVDNLLPTDFNAGLTIGSAGSEFSTTTFAGALTLAADKSLSAATTGPISFLFPTSDLAVSGSGSVTLTSARNISLPAGASITSVDGAISLFANQQATPTSGSFAGIDVNNALIQATGTGSVSLKGKGGNDPAGNQIGVRVRGGGDIVGGTSGTLSVNGTGGAGSGNFNMGIYVTGADSTIKSGGANVQLTGQGGGTGASANNEGVRVEQAGQVTAGGSGTVTVQGTGGVGGGVFNIGVNIRGANSAITSGGGNVQVTGEGGGAGNSADNYGVNVDTGGLLAAGGGGTVTVQGIGGVGSGDFNLGVSVQNASATITSSGGNVQVTGQGAGTGAGNSNYGVSVAATGLVTAGGNGTVTVLGTGGSASGNSPVGVLVSGSGSKITSSGANVQVTGQGGGTGASTSGLGVNVQASGEISAGGSGSVTVLGTGGTSSGTGNTGVLVAGASITSGGGDVQITGVGGSGSSLIAISIFSSTVSTATNGGSITLIGNCLGISSFSTISAGATSSVTLKPLTSGVGVNLGLATKPIGGPLGLTDAELDRVTAGSINIGDSNTGSITISAVIDRTTGSTTAINLTTGTNNDIVFTSGSRLDAENGNVTLLTNSSGTGAISGSPTLSEVIGANLSLTAGSGGIGASGSPLLLAATNLNATTGGNGNQFLRASASTTIDATGLSAGTGTIQLEGGRFTLGGSDRIDDNTKITVNGPTFDLGANNETIGGFTLISGSVTGTTGVLTSTSTYQTNSGLISAVLAGNVGLTQSTAGITTLSGANTYSGDTTITRSTLKLGADQVIPHGSGKGNVALNPTSGNTATLDLNGHSETINGLTNSGAGTSTIDNSVTGGPFTLAVGGNDQDGTFSGVIKNTAGTLALTKIGTGTLTLSGANTYNGDTTISNGTLKLGAAEVIPDGTGKGNVVFNPASGTATLLLAANTEKINGLSSSGAGASIIDTATAGNVGLLVGYNNQSSTFAGTIQDSSGPLSLFKQGSGKLTLTGINSYHGNTTVNDGTLALAANSTNNIANSATINSGLSSSILDVTGLTAGTIVLPSGQMLTGFGTVTGDVKATSGATISPGGEVGVLSAGAVTLVAGSTFQVHINGPAPSYSQLSTSGAVDLTGSTLTLSGIYAPVIGDKFTIVNNTVASNTTTGTFDGLPEGTVFSATLGNALVDLQINYHAGSDANDVVLTAVNVAPTLDPIGDRTVAEDAAQQTIGLTGISAGGAASQTISITATSDNPGIVPNPQVIYSSPDGSGTLKFQPIANQSGLVTITVTVQDDGGAGAGSDTLVRTFTVDVTEVNDPPIGVDDVLASVTEDSGQRSIPLSLLLGNDQPGPDNESSQTLAITSVSNVVGGTAGIVGDNVVFTPDTDYNGLASFVYSIVDDGTTNGQPDPQIGTATVSFTIDAVNDAPILQLSTQPITATDENPVTHGPASQTRVPGFVQSATAGPVTATDEAGQVLHFTITPIVPGQSGDAALFTGTGQPAIDPATGDLTFRVAPNANGTAHFLIVLKDDGGTASGGVDASAAQPFDIVITKPHIWHNTKNALEVNPNPPAPSPNPLPGFDVNDDGHVAANDVVAILNYINAFGNENGGRVPALGDPVPNGLGVAGIGTPYGFIDVNADDFVAANDALAIINVINAGQAGSEGEPAQDEPSQGDPASDDGSLMTLLAVDVALQTKRRR